MISERLQHQLKFGKSSLIGKGSGMEWYLIQNNYSIIRKLLLLVGMRGSMYDLPETPQTRKPLYPHRIVLFAFYSLSTGTIG
jgi:hypothetical protein